MKFCSDSSIFNGLPLLRSLVRLCTAGAADSSGIAPNSEDGGPSDVISSFQTLLTLAKTQDQPQRLLLLLAKTEAGASKRPGVQTGTITPIACVDRLPDEIPSFEAFVEEADLVSDSWDMVLIASLDGEQGIAPSSQDAEPHLDKMVNDLRSGEDLSRYLVLDRSANVVTMQPIAI